MPRRPIRLVLLVAAVTTLVVLPLKTTYRVAARPHTYFLDGEGIIRSIQIGELTDADIERHHERIAP